MKCARRCMAVVLVLVAQVLSLNEASAYTYGGGSTQEFTEGAVAQIVAPSITVSNTTDPAGVTTGTVEILNFTSGDLLSYSPPQGHCVSNSSWNNATGVLTITGPVGCDAPNASLWQTTFRNVSFLSTADTPDSTRMIRFSTNHPTGGSHTVTLSIRAGVPNQPSIPTVTAGDGQATISVQPSSTGPQARSHIVTASPSGRTCTVSTYYGSCTIDRLSNGMAYTFASVSVRGSAQSVSSPASLSVTPQQNSSTSDTATSQKIVNLGKIREGRNLALRTLATKAFVTIDVSSRVRVSIFKSSRKFCRVNANGIRGVRPGLCKITITVITDGESSTKMARLRVSV